MPKNSKEYIGGFLRVSENWKFVAKTPLRGDFFPYLSAK
jgi:hypothetical protein